MLPSQIAARFANPGMIESWFINFLTDAGLEIKEDKSIASLTVYDQNSVGSTARVVYFQGTLTPADTNMLNNFVRPSSEHMVIYGIRIESAAGIGPNAGFNYVPGTGGFPQLENGIITVVVNGVKVLVDYPLAEALNGLTTKDQGLILLDEPIIWPGEEQVEITFVTKATTPDATAKMRVSLIGIGLVS